MKKIDSMLFRMIRQSRGQFVAVLVIVAVGIAIFTAISLAGVNLNLSKEEYYVQSNFADLWVEVKSVPETIVEKTGKISGVKGAEGRIVTDAPFITENDQRVNVRLVSLNGKNQKINQLLYRQGREIQDPNKEVAVIAQFAQARGLKPGDDIQVQVNGLRYTLRIAGIVSSPEFIYMMENEQSLMANPENFGVLFVEEEFLQHAMNLPGAYNQVLFRYENGVDSEEQIIDEIENRLEPYGLQRTIKKKDQASNSMVGEEIKQLKNAGIALPVLFLLVAAFVLSMMLGRMVKRDRMKIGILKAIGYDNRSVLLHYTKYSLIAGILGGSIGNIVGFWVADYMTGLYADFFDIPSYGMRIHWNYFLWAMLLSCLFCIVSGIYGARESLHIAPAESMQAEAPKEGKRVFLQGFPKLWGSLTFSWKLIIKNVLRNKRRSGFVMLGVALTFGLIMFTMTMPQVIDDVMVKHFTEFQTMDYNVGFYQPLPADAVREISYELDDTSYVEGRIEYPFEFSVKNKKKSAIVIGMKQGSEFYHLKDLEDRPIQVEQGGVLLTENLAKSLGVIQGDQVRVKSYLDGDKKEVLTVTGIVKQTLGMNAYMEVSSMGERLLEKNIITGFYLDTQDGDVIEILRGADQVSTVTSTADMRSAYESYLGLMLLCISCLVLLSGVLGFCIVYNATLVSLGEREMEFSSLRVLGFGKGEIFRMMLKENLLLTVGGLILGIPAGYVMTGYSSVIFSTDLYTMYMTPTLRAIVYAWILTMLFLLIAQLATYKKIDQLDFLQALKNRAS